MKRNKAYKFRLYPTPEQEVQMNKTFGTCRYVWNMVLAYRKDLYAFNKSTYSYNQAATELTTIKKLEGYEWMKEVETVALQQSLRDLDSAYKNFFRKLKQGGKTSVNFKSKHSKQMYRTMNVNGTIHVNGKQIRLPKLSWVQFRYRKQIQTNEVIKSVTVSRTPTGKYFASVLVEYEHVSKLPATLDVSKLFSADMSAKHFMVSEQMEFENQKFYRKNQRRLVIRQRRLSKKVKGSSNRSKARLIVASFHEKISNQRRGFQRNLVDQLTSNFNAFSFEDLNTDSMKQFNSGLAKTVSMDFSWSEFMNWMEWKCVDRNKLFHKVSRWFPSSKMCSECGSVKGELPMNIRTYECDCGFVCDRDVNAARNLWNAGVEHFKQNGIQINTLQEKTLNHTVEFTEINALGDMSSGYTLSPGTVPCTC